MSADDRKQILDPKIRSLVCQMAEDSAQPHSPEEGHEIEVSVRRPPRA